jgi:hypothetical protein
MANIRPRKRKASNYFNCGASNAEFRRDADRNPHVGRKTAVRIISERFANPWDKDRRTRS